MYQLTSPPEGDLASLSSFIERIIKEEGKEKQNKKKLREGGERSDHCGNIPNTMEMLLFLGKAKDNQTNSTPTFFPP